MVKRKLGWLALGIAVGIVAAAIVNDGPDDGNTKPAPQPTPKTEEPMKARAHQFGGWCRAHKWRSSILGILVFGCLGVAAYAAWDLTGSGSGGNKVGNAQAITVTPGTASDACYPNSSCSVAVVFHNPNNSAVTVTSITATGQPVSGDEANCPSSYFSTSDNEESISVPVPANGTATYDTGQWISTGDLPNGCQGVELTVPVAVTGVTSS